MKLPRQQPINIKDDAPSALQLSLLIDMNDPLSVLEEIQTIMRLVHAGINLKPVETLFKDVVALFNGNYAGYRACNTGYHNLKHTTDTALAMARLLHGAHVGGCTFNERDLLLGLMAALMHDVGYIQEMSDREGTGAKLTPLHIQRGIEFAAHYLSDQGSPRKDIRFIQQAIQTTDLLRPVDGIRFSGENAECIGKILAASDLLAQTADRNYLEKLPLLFAEFQEAGMNDYRTEFDLIKDSIRFNQTMNQRLETDLSGVNRYMSTHFKIRWHIEKDLYQDSIDKSIQYLGSILAQDPPDFSAYLRRKSGV